MTFEMSKYIHGQDQTKIIYKPLRSCHLLPHLPHYYNEHQDSKRNPGMTAAVPLCVFGDPRMACWCIGTNLAIPESQSNEVHLSLGAVKDKAQGPHACWALRDKTGVRIICLIDLLFPFGEKFSRLKQYPHVAQSPHSYPEETPGGLQPPLDLGE